MHSASFLVRTSSLSVRRTQRPKAVHPSSRLHCPGGDTERGGSGFSIVHSEKEGKNLLFLDYLRCQEFYIWYLLVLEVTPLRGYHPYFIVGGKQGPDKQPAPGNAAQRARSGIPVCLPPKSVIDWPLRKYSFWAVALLPAIFHSILFFSFQFFGLKIVFPLSQMWGQAILPAEDCIKMLIDSLREKMERNRLWSRGEF